jgi:hypothetical protein
MSDYPMLISNKLHSFRNFLLQIYVFYIVYRHAFNKKMSHGASLTQNRAFVLILEINTFHAFRHRGQYFIGDGVQTIA